ncbi:hypothetical protein BDV59DRAFT_202548 [Aspergillus ambiguus]|uniref:uncharacterized protein n=1 Tax=Aspergillus ambiguus TaxID=176160 RepID=UPI003CCDC51B
MDRLPVRTHHCRFCNHLLFATTRDLASLPRRKPPAQDAAMILPLPTDTHETDPDRPEGDAEARKDGEATEAKTAATTPTTTQPHYTILLSTTIPERKPTLIRREDGFEKRLLLRCGRCRVVMGYFLDPVHFPDATAQEDEESARVVYILPGAVMETGIMGTEEKMKAMDGEWSGWIR